MTDVLDFVRTFQILMTYYKSKSQAHTVHIKQTPTFNLCSVFIAV